MSNKKESSIEFLEEALSIHFTHEKNMQFLGLFIQAKEIHKQEIIDAYSDGRFSAITHDIISYEQYYKETYETDN